MERKKCCALRDRGDCPHADGFGQTGRCLFLRSVTGKSDAGLRAPGPCSLRSGQGRARRDGGTEKARGAFGPALRM